MTSEDRRLLLEQAYAAWLTAAVDRAEVTGEAAGATVIAKRMRAWLKKHDRWADIPRDSERHRWQRLIDHQGNHIPLDQLGNNVRAWHKKKRVPVAPALREALIDVVDHLAPYTPVSVPGDGVAPTFGELLHALADDRNAGRQREVLANARQHRATQTQSVLRASGRSSAIDPATDLGLGSWAYDSGAPPYVARTADAQLAGYLTASPQGVIVTVCGPPKSGKTRSVYQVLKEILPDAVCWWHNPQRRAIPALLNRLDALRTSVDARPEVIILDDFDLNGLSPDDGATVSRLNRIATTPSVRAVVVIVHTEVLAIWRDQASGGRRQSIAATTELGGDELSGIGATSALMHRLDTAVVVYSAELDPTEADAATAIRVDLADRARDLDVTRLAEALASVDKLSDAARRALAEGSTRGALVEAAIDATSINPAGVSIDMMLKLTRLHHRRLAPNARWHPNAFDNAFDKWATVGLSASSPHSIIVRTQSSPHDTDAYRLLDALTPHLRAPNRSFDHLDDPALSLTADEQLQVGLSAYDAGQPQTAEKWWMNAAGSGHPEAMYNLGFQAYIADQPVAGHSAEQWYKKAADHNHAKAMASLGYHAHVSGVDVGGLTAQQWWARAADLGDPVAMSNLGTLAGETGRSVAGHTAEQWYKKAADHDYAVAMHNLGTLALHPAQFVQGDTTEQLSIAGHTAEQWYKKAADHGHGVAMLSLALRAEVTGKSVAGHTAEQWYEKAAAHNQPEAMLALAHRAEGTGKAVAGHTAEQWWAKATDLGQPEAMHILGHWAADAGKAVAGHTAEEWWAKAAAHNHGRAMASLGFHTHKVGKAVAGHTAEEWWAKAAAHKNADAMFNLGMLARKTGQTVRGHTAEEWWAKAGDLGQPEAMFKLGMLARETPLIAEEWWVKAAAHNHPQAMFSLGILAHSAGGSRAGSTAEQWWIKAASLDYAPAMYNLGVLAAQNGDFVAEHSAEQWWAKAAALGDVDATAALAWYRTNDAENSPGTS